MEKMLEKKNHSVLNILFDRLESRKQKAKSHDEMLVELRELDENLQTYARRGLRYEHND